MLYPLKILLSQDRKALFGAHFYHIKQDKNYKVVRLYMYSYTRINVTMECL